MSAYVVEDRTINRIVSYLFNEAAASRVNADPVVLRPLGGIGHDLACASTHPEPALREACEKLGKAMHFLNVSAVRGRYENADDMIPEAYVYLHEIPSTPLTVYKSLRCWLYQCSENGIPESSPLFKAMEQIADILANMIVQDLPKYDAAPWS